MTHFYLDGKPYYTILGKDGKERDTTLRDARKVNACIGVTSIIGQLDKFQLNQWKKKRLLEVIEDKAKNKKLVFFDKWKEAILAESEERDSIYSKRGNEVHDILEQYFTDGTIHFEDEKLLLSVIGLLHDLYGEEVIYESEKSFSHADGFGGTIDLIIHTPDGKIIIDFKTKNKSGLGSHMCTDDYMMQLAAYRKAEDTESELEPIILCANLLIGLEDLDERPYFHIWSDAKLDKGEKMFYNLLEFWKLQNNYGV